MNAPLSNKVGEETHSWGERRMGKRQERGPCFTPTAAQSQTLSPGASLLAPISLSLGSQQEAPTVQ